MPKKIKLDLSKAWLSWGSLTQGIVIYALFHYDYPLPLGLVWGIRAGGKKIKFQVFGSFVAEFARRQGVRTKINQEIFRTGQAAVIYSGVTAKSGELFMRATGYKFDAQSDWWILTKPTVKKKRGA